MIRLSKRSDAQQIFYLLNSPTNLKKTLQFVDSELVKSLSGDSQFIVVEGEEGLEEVVGVPDKSSVSRFACFQSSLSPSFLTLLLTQGLLGKLSLLSSYPEGSRVLDVERGDTSLYSIDLVERTWFFPSQEISSEVFSSNEEEVFADSLESVREKRSELVPSLIENYQRCSFVKKELIRYDH